jgi:hypothetical protein
MFLLVFIGNVLSEGNKVQILITKEINSAILSTDFYDGLKEYYQKKMKNKTRK